MFQNCPPDEDLGSGRMGWDAANALGTPPPDLIERIQQSGRAISALCGSPSQAGRHTAAGLDFIAAQGTEGGGHTGEIGSMVL